MQGPFEDFVEDFLVFGEEVINFVEDDDTVEKMKINLGIFIGYGIEWDGMG